MLQIRDALLPVFMSSSGKERVQKAMASLAAKYKSLKNVVTIVRDTFLFDQLGAHLDALMLTIEWSLVMQGGLVTLADAMYCLIRQHQALVAAGEGAVIESWRSGFPISRSQCSSSRCGCILHTPKLGRP
jgi:hypothetical protein